MSISSATKQLVGSDFAFQTPRFIRSSLCPGSLHWSSPSKHVLSNIGILQRTTSRISSGRSHQLGSRAFGGAFGGAGAPSGTVSTAVGSNDLIVMGLPSSDALAEAPVGADGASAPQQSPLLVQVGTADVSGSNIPALLVTKETLTVESDGFRSLQLRGELRSVDIMHETIEVVPLQKLPATAASVGVVDSSSNVRSTLLGSSAVAEESTAASVYVVAQAADLISGAGVASGDAAAADTPGSSITHSVAAGSSTTGATIIAVQQQQQQGHKQQQQKTPAQSQGLWDRLVDALRSIHWGKLWALTLLSISYVHQATTGFALPAMLPMISSELHLTDMQGALLTTGYSYLYAVALVPIGLLADRVSRPRLLAAGLALWSLLTVTASGCRSFGELLLARVGFAAAQGAQNPVCFSLIPELFPATKSTALALYNCAIYVGRALSFAAVLLARHLHDNDQAHLAARGGARTETRLDHLDRADLHSLSIMHTTGDMAAAAPDKEFNFPIWEYGSELPDAAWRQVLRWIAVPGFLIGLAMMATLQEPRHAAVQRPAAAPPAVAATIAASPAAATAPLRALPLAAAPAVKDGDFTRPAAAAAAVHHHDQQPQSGAVTAGSGAGGISALLRSPGFMSVTLAAALNDVGSYALIAWQSTFYERVYGLEPASYAPVLAALLPIGGILGGVGGGYLADRLSRSGRRGWVTGGATCLAAPCLALSCLAPSPELSYAALLLGFALSEMWRAPSAVMARGIAPPSMGSTASALYLCVRNLVGGLGPLAVAGLMGACGLQAAMLVVPAMYLGSGLVFAQAEKLYDAEMVAKTKAGLL